MPIFQIRSLLLNPSINRQYVLKKLCCESAKIFGLESHHVWGTWEDIAAGLYVEGDKEALTQPRATHPPLVNLVAFEGRHQDVIEKALNHAASLICAELGLEPDNIFVTYSEAMSGRVHTGGEIRRKSK